MDASIPGHRLKSPTRGLIAGLAITLIIMAAHAAYTLYSVDRMRKLQSDFVDRNRKGSLQLIRIQSDLNALALAMRDMLENPDHYPLSAWSGQLTRIRENLDDAIRTESQLAEGRRDPRQTAYLASSFEQFWASADRMLEISRAGDDVKARSLIQATLQPRQEALSALVARLLIANNDDEQRGTARVNEIYTGIERNAWIFLAASVLLVAFIGGTLIRANRVLFQRITELSDQRSDLARQLITTQESTFRAISRDLHDEFGQILTALGAMLRRANREAPSSEFREQIRELNQVVQETLDKTRSLSQSLQPVILEEQGLGSAIQWHLSVFERQNGIAVHYDGPRVLPEMEPARSIHIFRIVQEALNNIARHAGVKEAFIHTSLDDSQFSLAVEDHGSGIPQSRGQGIGLVAMRERAELLGGSLSIAERSGGGTIIQLSVPLGKHG